MRLRTKVLSELLKYLCYLLQIEEPHSKYSDGLVCEYFCGHLKNETTNSKCWHLCMKGHYTKSLTHVQVSTVIYADMPSKKDPQDVKISYTRSCMCCL